MKYNCPHCAARMHVRTSRAVSLLSRELYLQCPNVECAYTCAATAGGRQPVRIFSPRGCYLLGMLARTERAKAFRRWVLDVLEGRQVPRKVAALTVPQHLAALRYRGALVRELGAATSLPIAQELHANLLHVSRLLGMSTQPLAKLAPIASQQTLPGVA